MVYLLYIMLEIYHSGWEPSEWPWLSRSQGSENAISSDLSFWQTDIDEIKNAVATCRFAEAHNTKFDLHNQYLEGEP